MRYNFDLNRATDACIKWIQNFFDKNGPTCNAVVGISGGKDSTVVASLCVKALGADRVIGVIMPNGIQPDFNDAQAVCDALGIREIVVNIGASYNEMVAAIEDDNVLMSEQAIINLPCRLRMSALYAVSQSLNGRVANTCNLSENYIFYYTRWGDGVGDFAPLANLLSDEVIAIGKYLNMVPEYLLDKIPSDGLCGKTDEDNFGFSYSDLNEHIMTGECPGGPEISEKIEMLHRKNMFKGRSIPEYTPYFE